MERFSIRYKSRRIIRFVSIQFLALLGWIAVQSYFSLSSMGHALPFVLIVFIEAVWWSTLLFIMFLLFLLEYRRFVQAAVDVEESIPIRGLTVEFFKVLVDRFRVQNAQGFSVLE